MEQLMSDDKRRDRLRFRSWHRGTREMDLLLGSFADANLYAFSVAEVDQYEALLEQSDPDLYNWIIGSEQVPSDCDSAVMRKLCAHRFASKQVG
jgi:antitoxin CptB